MKTSAPITVVRKKKRLGEVASTVGAGFAAVAVICSVFSPALAQYIALAGAVADIGTRLLIRFV